MKTVKTMALTMLAGLVLAMGFAPAGVLAADSNSIDAKSIRAIGDQEAEYALASMERLTGKAILLPEVVAMVGVLRYAEATDNKKLIERVAELYKAAYINDGCLNRLTAGHIESQATAIIPLELYRLTGDESLLKGCWRVVVGQLRDAQANGAYRHARWYTDDMFIISMLQTEASNVYGGTAGLKFVEKNLPLYMAKLNAENTWFERWKEWDADGKEVGMGIREMIWVLPRDHETRGDFDKQYLASQGMCDPVESFAGFSIAELLKKIGIESDAAKPLLAEYRKIMAARYERLASGKMISTKMHPFVELTSMATGVRYGWLTDAKYKKLLDAKWADYATDYQPPKMESWNVIYKPLLRQGGRLLFATAMLNLDKKITAPNGKPMVEIVPLKRKFSADEVASALKMWGDLRFAEASDDVKLLEKIQGEFKFDGTNPLQMLVAMELYRLTGNYDYERRCVEILHDLLQKPLDDAGLTAILFQEGFDAYGTVIFADAAKKIGLPQEKINAILKPTADLLAKLKADAEANKLKIPTVNADAVCAENIYKIGLAADVKSADKLRELCEALQSPTGFFHQAVNGNIANDNIITNGDRRDACGTNDLCDSRSSGQAIAGVAAFLKSLPADSKDAKVQSSRAYFLRVFKNFAYAAERDQDHDGLWHMLPEDFNSPQDTLGSAFFVAALATGLEQKWIHRLEFREIVNLGWKGIQGYIKGGKLINAAAATTPRKIASSYALLPRVTGDALGQLALQSATAATKSYLASDIPGSPEDLIASIGPMGEARARDYEGVLPDGRLLKHVSARTRFEITFPIDIRQAKVDKLVKENPGLYTEDDFRCSFYEILDKKKMLALPEAIKKLRYPVAGISAWMQDNPSIHTVSDDLGYCVMSMPYVPLAKGGSNSKMMVQIPGFKPVPAHKHGNYIDKMVAEVDDIEVMVSPKGPSDSIGGKPLSSFLLNHNRQERKELLAMLGKDVEEIAIDAGAVMRPVYLRGKVVSAADGKPVDEVSVWLKRNPFLMHRGCDNGEFEVMMKDAALYDQTSDALMFTAPNYKPTEVAIKSYMDDKISVTMEPLNYNPIVSSDTSVPMVRIPGGFFRMGFGFIRDHLATRTDARDWDDRHCWPIQTVSVPSFYFSQYNLCPRFREELSKWALANGYSAGSIRQAGMSGGKSMAFPLMLNAMSERDGFTPCYYTGDLRVMRSDDDLSENMVCNWRADGYRLPTWAEWEYTCRAGRTTTQINGDFGDRYRDYYISYGAFYNENMAPKRHDDPAKAALQSGKHRSQNDARVTYSPHARRMPLDWGVYGATIGMGRNEMPWDMIGWRADQSYHPRGPAIRESRQMDRLLFDAGSKARVGRFSIGVVDNLETQWQDQWAANPIGFQYSGFAFNLTNISFFVDDTDTLHSSVVRLARTAENVCNDIRLVKSFDDPNLKNPKPVDLKTIGAEIAMAQIPAGEFTMGAGFLGDWYNGHHGKGLRGGFIIGSSAPEHKVKLSNFSMSKFEVTVQQWREVQKWALANGYTDLPEGGFGDSSSDDPRHPVVEVSWFDVIKWCNAASEKAGLKPCYTVDGKVLKTGMPDKKEKVSCDWKVDGYRLPTEAEWEYAEQAGSDGCFYWGDDKGYQFAWRGGRSYDNCGKASHPVGQKIGNRFGLYDTIGNVWEWTWDWMGPHIMNLEVQQDPKGPESWQDVLDFLKEAKTWKGREATEKGKTTMGKCKYDQGGKCVKGAGYDTTIQKFYFVGSQYRGGISPEKSHKAVGFRVVQSGKAGK